MLPNGHNGDGAPGVYFACHFHRALDKREGAAEGTPHVCVAHALPGNLTAWGSDPEKARKNLDKLLRDFGAKLGDGADAWYESAFDAMTEEEKATWQRIMSSLPQPVYRQAGRFGYMAPSKDLIPGGAGAC